MAAPYQNASGFAISAMISGLIDWIERRPRESFAVFALFHGALWTALPSALYPNLPLDLIEALTYGREWQLGYDKLPPLPWWIIEAAYRLFDNGKASPEAIREPHTAGTVKRMVACGGPVLVAQDTVSFSYGEHPKTCGLGPIGSKHARKHVV